MSNDPKDPTASKSEPVLRMYKNRLKTLRQAQEYSQKDDIPKAVECYGQYLNSLAEFFGVDETKLKPDLFDQEKDLAELLLISHVYWDLSKAYDRSPNLHLESIRCLDQFIKFTSGYKYQYVNARMLKNFIRKRLAHNPKAFKQAYDRIQVESKGCFISSDIYGVEHIQTERLRLFKKSIIKYKVGFLFSNLYYQQIVPTYYLIKKIAPKPLFIAFKAFLKIILNSIAFFYSRKN